MREVEPDADPVALVAFPADRRLVFPPARAFDIVFVAFAGRVAFRVPFAAGAVPEVADDAGLLVFVLAVAFVVLVVVFALAAVVFGAFDVEVPGAAGWALAVITGATTRPPRTTTVRTTASTR